MINVIVASHGPLARRDIPAADAADCGARHLVSDGQTRCIAGESLLLLLAAVGVATGQ